MRGFQKGITLGVGFQEVPEKLSVVVGGGLLHFNIYLSPLQGEMSRTKSTRQVLDIFLDIERRQETRRGDRLRQY